MAKSKRGGVPGDPVRYRWIVDGHNAIFAHAELERLQTGGEKGEARRRLEQMLERFAARYGVAVQVVYDGNRIEHNPDRYRGPKVSSTYTLAPEEADDRIIWMATSAAARGEKVAVVSSDRRTLGSRLPRGVVQVEPSALFERLAGEGPKRPRGRPPGDYEDIERHFLEVDARAKPDEDDAPPRMTPRPVDLGRPRASPAIKRAEPDARRAEEEAGVAPRAGRKQAGAEEKKERGRMKHERRVARREIVRRKSKKRR